MKKREIALNETSVEKCSPDEKCLPAVVSMPLISVSLPQWALADGKPVQGPFLNILAGPTLVNRLAAADYREWGHIIEGSKLSGIGSYGIDAPMSLRSHHWMPCSGLRASTRFLR